ncbi:MAG TPA: hypothetical protein VK020_08955 [Microlunatus sp.]|nr:hypothetical protein [Microlunatus sp.]
MGLRAPARTADCAVGYLVRPNGHATRDPQPGERQGFDGYPIEISIRLGSCGSDQLREAQLIFDELIRARADLPMLLCHDLDILVAAYRPDRGQHEFPPDTTVDEFHTHRWLDQVART